MKKEKNMIQFPTSWEELTREQYEFIFSQLVLLEHDKITVYDFKVRVILFFCEMKNEAANYFKETVRRRNNLVKYDENRLANIYQLTETLDWLITYKEVKKKWMFSFEYTSVKNYLPQIKAGGRIFKGPVDGMLDITFGEYRYAVDLLLIYSKYKSESTLDKFVGCLYRPSLTPKPPKPPKGGPTRDTRQDFDPGLIDAYGIVASKIPFHLKYAIYLWFANCDKYIREGEIQLGPREVCFSELFKPADDTEEPGTRSNDLGLTGLLYNVAESGLFGKPDEVDKQQYIDVLLALKYWDDKNQKMKRK
jgi:hypothetical protein